MLLALIAFVLGFGIGWIRASRREGLRIDKVQMGLAHGIPAAICGLILSIVLVRIGL